MNSDFSFNFPHETELNHSEAKTESFEDTELESENFTQTLSFQSNQIEGAEEETTQLIFKFQYQSWNCNIGEEEELKESYGQSCDFSKRVDDTVSVTSANKYDFVKNQVTDMNYNTSNSQLFYEKKFMPEYYVGGSGNARILDNSTERVNIYDFLSEDDIICSSSDSDSIVSVENTIELDTLREHDEKNAGLTDSAGEEKSSCDGFRDSNNSKHEESAKLISQTLAAFDIEDSNKFDTLLKHQEMFEQHKTELKKVRATGLPTILEDSESPRIMDDFKPWKTDTAKLQHGNELHKFYRSYKERMRKFDIINCQKMYAIGFLQSKEPCQSFSSRKSSTPAIASILPQRFRFGTLKNAEPDPTKKLMRELYSDMEMVYVGQLCLSWEFLHWQYDKALKLWESDQYGLRRFNEVAGEFQQFQVLLQRFMEDEPFQGGTRVENYVKNRCVMRNLLQVPVIREDRCKDKKKFRKREADKDAITSDTLVEILEESIRTIWRFIKADKDPCTMSHKGLRETQVELQNSTDFELLIEIQTNLEKKEKKLRELLKSGSCILNKFKKYHEDETEQVLYFFSQVDMKLVWRVLKMSMITTDQLAWCHSKLNNINFVNKRILVEHSFSFFPS
ncbi:putative ribosomal protein L34Ae [Lupinus albus]|uniref:Putative ribosomal protein L34Ae n=1 Tax=Lupinus albus TaxID=3870 RepID=A0A6A4N687_LUPAL|nr:putative ribosomal protein L34Ae [Lupinus albus]